MAKRRFGCAIMADTLKRNQVCALFCVKVLRSRGGANQTCVSEHNRAPADRVIKRCFNNAARTLCLRSQNASWRCWLAGLSQQTRFDHAAARKDRQNGHTHYPHAVDAAAFGCCAPALARPGSAPAPARWPPQARATGTSPPRRAFNQRLARGVYAITAGSRTGSTHALSSKAMNAFTRSLWIVSTKERSYVISS